MCVCAQVTHFTHFAMGRVVHLCTACQKHAGACGAVHAQAMHGPAAGVAPPAGHVCTYVGLRAHVAPMLHPQAMDLLWALRVLGISLPGPTASAAQVRRVCCLWRGPTFGNPFVFGGLGEGPLRRRRRGQTLSVQRLCVCYPVDARCLSVLCSLLRTPHPSGLGHAHMRAGTGARPAGAGPSSSRASAIVAAGGAGGIAAAAPGQRLGWALAQWRQRSRARAGQQQAMQQQASAPFPPLAAAEHGQCGGLGG